MRIGVLALQGAFREHILMLETLGVDAVPVRLPSQLTELVGLIIPGGESTAISKLMDTYGFFDPIRQHHQAGMALWGTCAGAILLAEEVIDSTPGQDSLRLMDIVARRNAIGRQVDSFETDIDFAGVGLYRGVFIRAPWIESVGPSANILAKHADKVVAARQGDMLATVFHPELTGDLRIHRYFVEKVVGSQAR